MGLWGSSARHTWVILTENSSSSVLMACGNVTRMKGLVIRQSELEIVQYLFTPRFAYFGNGVGSGCHTASMAHAKLLYPTAVEPTTAFILRRVMLTLSRSTNEKSARCISVLTGAWVLQAPAAMQEVVATVALVSKRIETHGLGLPCLPWNTCWMLVLNFLRASDNPQFEERAVTRAWLRREPFLLRARYPSVSLLSLHLRSFCFDMYRNDCFSNPPPLSQHHPTCRACIDLMRGIHFVATKLSSDHHCNRLTRSRLCPRLQCRRCL